MGEADDAIPEAKIYTTAATIEQYLIEATGGAGLKLMSALLLERRGRCAAANNAMGQERTVKDDV
jgi:hypothetical protein